MRSLPLLLFIVSCAAGARPSATVVVAPTAAGVEPQSLPTFAAPAPLKPVFAQDEEDAAVPIAGDDPTWGSRTAMVTLVEFSDFQCPFCGRAKVSIDALKQAYGPGRLRVVWKNFPLAFHPNAKPAAEAAVGVHALGGNDAFWTAHDLFFGNQGALDRVRLEGWVAQSGVSARAVSAGLDAGTWSARVRRDLDLGARLNVSGTPTFFVNGRNMVGAQPVEKFQEIIDEELQKAEARVAAGVSVESIYKVMAEVNHPVAALPDAP